MQKASHASILESVLSRGVQAALAEQKPHALQSHRVQWAEACRSRQKLLQPSTLPSSLAAGLHALLAPPTIAANDDDGEEKEGDEEEGDARFEVGDADAPCELPQKRHALHAHAEQCTPRCS